MSAPPSTHPRRLPSPASESGDRRPETSSEAFDGRRAPMLVSTPSMLPAGVFAQA